MPTDLPGRPPGPIPADPAHERPLRRPGTLELDPEGGEGVAVDETPRLIASGKVEGTAVYDGTGRHLGAIHTVMLDKVSGQVAYAVLAFGGFLGLGETHHPLPWNALAYSVELGGYVVDIDPAVLGGAPTGGPGSTPGTDTPATGHAHLGEAGPQTAPAA